MSIIVNSETRLLVQGITGKEGAYHAVKCREYGTNLVAGVTPGKGGQVIDGDIPVFNTVQEAVDSTGADTSLVFVPPAFAADAIAEAADSGISTIASITEGIPVSDTMRVAKYIKGLHNVRLLGPNCPGVISPGEKCKIGIMPGNIHRKGSVGIKGKNLIKIQNQEIAKIALKLAIKCPAIDYVVLSTDSNKILNLIKENKKLIKLKRNKNLAKNNTPMLPVMKNAITFFEKIKKKEISKLVIFDPTSPLRSIKDIQKAIKIFNKEKPDLLLSVHEGQHNPYFSMVEKKGKYFKLCKNSEKNPGARQQVPLVYEINTIVWIYSRKAIFSGVPYYDICVDCNYFQ